jgi:hypothetical protein
MPGLNGETEMTTGSNPSDFEHTLEQLAGVTIYGDAQKRRK